MLKGISMSISQETMMRLVYSYYFEMKEYSLIANLLENKLINDIVNLFN